MGALIGLFYVINAILYSMKYSIILLTLLVSFKIFGQDAIFYKTIKKQNVHYLEFSNDKVIVYKMGSYHHHAGSGPSIILTDTLLKKHENEFSGSIYTLLKTNTSYTLLTNENQKLETQQENNMLRKI